MIKLMRADQEEEGCSIGGDLVKRRRTDQEEEG